MPTAQRVEVDPEAQHLPTLMGVVEDLLFEAGVTLHRAVGHVVMVEGPNVEMLYVQNGTMMISASYDYGEDPDGGVVTWISEIYSTPREAKREIKKLLQATTQEMRPMRVGVKKIRL
jgi:hypothetical protein